MNGLEDIPGVGPSQRERIERLIAESPSPPLARSHLLRLLETSDPASLNERSDEALSALFHLLGGSAFLSEILVGVGEPWPRVFHELIRISVKRVAQHLADVSPLLHTDPSLEQLARVIRRHKQRENLRIGARDLSFRAPPIETMNEMTSLADACLEIAYRYCRTDLEKDFGRLTVPGTDKDNGLTILGMGKLGGEELNFSSDINLIYLYEDDQGESTGGKKGKTVPQDFFTRLAERITRLMGEVTEDGFVFLDRPAPKAPGTQRPPGPIPRLNFARL